MGADGRAYPSFGMTPTQDIRDFFAGKSRSRSIKDFCFTSGAVPEKSEGQDIFDHKYLDYNIPISR